MDYNDLIDTIEQYQEVERNRKTPQIYGEVTYKDMAIPGGGFIRTWFWGDCVFTKPPTEDAFEEWLDMLQQEYREQ